jgi:hypothetical protein
MLATLCGSQSVQRILTFLFVNGKCYGAQLNRQFKASLTPIQKALQRLEKGGIVMSYLEGKTRVYQFDPSFPLLEELEALLKKTYTLLSPQEKKQYSLVTHAGCGSGLSRQDHAEVVRNFWDILSNVKKLTFSAKSKEASGWNGRGKGEVTVTKESANVLLFHEKGSWHNKQYQEIDFSNTFRWTLDPPGNTISLEHLRFGASRPVFLFQLAPIGRTSLSSIDSHLCGGDVYFGQVMLDARCLRLNWRVIGPKKNEEIDYFYAAC